MANIPLLVAEERGLFEKYGVNVKIQRFSSGPLAIRALEAGDLDMAYIGMPPLYHAYERGQRFRIVAKVNYGQAALITHTNSPIQSLKDLRGKKIAGIRAGSGMDVLLRAYILEELAELDSEKDVKIIPMPAKIMHGALMHDVVDAAFTWEPYVSEAILADKARIVLDLNKFIPKYPWYVIAATEHATGQHRQYMFKVLQAHREAVQYLSAHPDAGTDLIMSQFRLDAKAVAVGAQVLPEEIVREARHRLGWQCSFNEQDKYFLQRLIRYSQQLGYIKQPIKVDELIDQEAIEFINQR